MTTVNTISTKSLIEQKLKLVEYSLENTETWYDGSAIRDLLKKSIFSPKVTSNAKNSVLDSTDWPAYCHYSSKSAFINMLHHHGINEASKILVHPLLPSELIDILIDLGSTIVCSDINTTTLSFDEKTYQNQLQLEKNNLDLVIHFCDNGLYKPVQELSDYTKNLSIPSMIIVNSQTITQELVTLFYSSTMGSVLWNTNSYFSDPILTDVTKKSQNQVNWTVSWFLDPKAKPISKNNLEIDKSLYSPVISSFYKELLEKYHNFGIQTIFYDFSHKMARRIKSYNKTTGDKKIQETVESILSAAVPNIVFQIKKTEGLAYDSSLNLNDLDSLSKNIQKQTKALESILSKEIIEIGKKNDQVVSIIDNYTYLKYFFYTDDKQFWADWAFKKNLKIYELQPLHGVFTATKLPNATMISNKIVYFDTVDYLI